MNNDELQHYGIPGMRWGKRKAIPVNRELRPGTKRINDTRNAMKARKDKYLSDERSDKAFDNTYKKTYNQLLKSGMRKGKAESKAMKTAMKRAGEVDTEITNKYRSDMKKLKAEYKQARKEGKKDRKQDLKEAYKNVKKSTSLGERLVFNKSTRKTAAKYIVDHNMTFEAAKRAANQKAIRNTALILGVIGAQQMFRKK